jgi:two-component system, cell cycle response regulator DivK
MSQPHILIVDDNRFNIDVLTMLLSQEGISYSSLESPRSISEALEQIEPVDAVFLDLEFPNGDGLKLLSELKADPRLSGVPIVAYTVHTGKINEAQRAGFVSFIGKPLDIRRFPNQLKRILNNQAVWEV